MPLSIDPIHPINLPNDVDWFPMLEDWKGLRSIMMVKTKRLIKEKLEIDTRYHICSLPAESGLLKDAARKHWSIENSCYWVLDVTYGEDASRVRKGNGAENLSRLKRLTINILRQDTTSKASIAVKRFEAALDDGYRELLLKGGV